jgi:hypothetical protein
MNNKQFATLVSITFLVGMMWLIADIIFNTKASIPVSPKLQTLLEPLNPNFNPRVLEIIDKEVPEKAPITAAQPLPVEITSQSFNVSQEGSASAQITP